MDTAKYEKLITEARKRTNDKIEAAKRKYGLGTYSRYQIDLSTATIRFLDDTAAERIRADIQAAGSWSPESETWLWAWDNDSIPEGAKARLAHVREFGEKHDFEPLMGSFDRCDEGGAWSMASVAADLLNAECVYRAPGPKSRLFLLLFNVRKLA